MDAIHILLGQLVDFIGSLGYVGIFVLTFIESTFVPLPSELVLIPAGYLAQQGRMDIWLLWAISTLGTLGGSLFNYWIAYVFGRRFLLSYGKYMFMPEDRLQKVEIFFNDHGSFSTFIGRLMPGVRHFIPFPAGLAKMPLGKFCLYTTLGGGSWMGILLGLGYLVGNNKAVINEYMHIIHAFIGVFIVLLAISYGWYYSNKKRGMVLETPVPSRAPLGEPLPQLGKVRRTTVPNIYGIEEEVIEPGHEAMELMERRSTTKKKTSKGGKKKAGAKRPAGKRKAPAAKRPVSSRRKTGGRKR
jgi:membrane protein DedA with SNARE-associated domain